MPSGHFEGGRPVMVDVGDKAETTRTAVAESRVTLPGALVERLSAEATRLGEKGDAVAVAELAGIMAAKRTADLIPLCHPLPLTHVAVKGEVESDAVRFTATCSTRARTGVEMEALVAASIAALTLYDMLKGAGHEMEIVATRLLSKDGGRSGSWRR
ncbi:MAG TPA: cyclic pyranopterin monophosphate synthase MoaC [Trueperaceae bacterium]|nr:cyclic pyranopterin monophosphate synthase MoaC [Trueperaceae bacterium]